MDAIAKDFERQAGAVRDTVEGGLDAVREYGRPLMRRYGRTALVVGVIGLAGLGVAMMVARRRRRRHLAVRLREALPDMLSSRLERPLASIRSAGDLLSR